MPLYTVSISVNHPPLLLTLSDATDLDFTEPKMPQFKEIELNGNAYDRGLSHGEQLREEIHATLAFYKSIFKLSDTAIFEHARYFRQRITDFNAEYMDEINGIAAGVNIDPLWIVALNSRTEILSVNADIHANECTVIGFPDQRLIGQNWDWSNELESLTTLMRVNFPSGHRILMLSEPGIIGKIGMNVSGLGVCLNILSMGRRLTGVPIHIILRAVLDCESVTQAKALIESHYQGKSSNILIADKSGTGLNVEFADDERFETDNSTSSILYHTNHYLGKGINSRNDPAFRSSYTRYDRVTELIASGLDQTQAEMDEILSDKVDRVLPIHRRYVHDAALGKLGTVFTVLMDLQAGLMRVRKGNAPEAEFNQYLV